MLLLYIGLYVLFCVIIWGFFLIMRVHALKFVNFSHHLQNVINLVLITLGILTVAGFILIFFLPTDTSQLFSKSSGSERFFKTTSETQNTSTDTTYY